MKSEFSNSINNFGLLLQQDVSELSLKYFSVLTKKKKQNIVTPTQTVDFTINAARLIFIHLAHIFTMNKYVYKICKQIYIFLFITLVLNGKTYSCSTDLSG